MAGQATYLIVKIILRSAQHSFSLVGLALEEQVGVMENAAGLVELVVELP